MSAFTTAQRHQAIGLYKRVIRTAQKTFAGDAATATAWQAMVREEFQRAKAETDAEKINQGLATWEDVIKVLRQNVVQGELNDRSNAFRLKFTPDTELGSNESIKQNRQKQMDQLRASKGKLACGGSSPAVTASASTSTSIPSSSRAYHSSAVLRRQPSEKEMQNYLTREQARSGNEGIDLWRASLIPRPVLRFTSMTVLADGSTIHLNTTSPRSVTRLTRDFTNHPLWNPRADRGRGGVEEEESGRLARFRKRFADQEEAAAAPAAVSESADAKAKAKDAAPSATPQPTSGRSARAAFSKDDFDWMSVGGREVHGKAPVPEKKGAKGKGKR